MAKWFAFVLLSCVGSNLSRDGAGSEDHAMMLQTRLSESSDLQKIRSKFGDPTVDRDSAATFFKENQASLASLIENQPDEWKKLIEGNQEWINGLFHGSLHLRSQIEEKKQPKFFNELDDLLEQPILEQQMDREVVSQVPTSGKKVSVATFNTGLAPVLLYKRERRDPIIRRLIKKNADVICLQEIWTKPDKDRFVRELKGKYPFAYHSSKESERFGGCTTPEFLIFVTCVLSDPAGQANCLRKSVPDASGKAEISTECVQCFLAQYLETNEYVKSMAQCPFGKLGTKLDGNLDAYDGKNGLMIFSKHDFKQTWRVDLTGFFIKRSMLMARIGDLTIGCTHFATENAMPYAGAHGAAGEAAGYNEENRLNFVEATTYMNNHLTGARLLLGDMNSGPAIAADVAAKQTKIDAYLPDNYAVAVTAGFTTASPVPAFCTWCYPTEEKPFYDTPKGNIILDHIFHKGFTAAPVAKHIFTKVLKIKKAFAEDVETPLSDHEAGIQATFMMP